MIYLHQFPFYNYCFDEERLENLYKNFNENKGEYTNGVKTLIQLRFISFCSDSKATFLKIDTPKNANFFFQELLDELDKSIEICENLSSKNLDKDFKYFITQIKRMNIWMIDEIIEKFDRQVEYVKNYKKSINISNEETETDKYKRAAVRLLEEHTAEDLVAAFLKSLSKDATDVPVKITPERPLPSRKGKGGGGYKGKGEIGRAHV